MFAVLVGDWERDAAASALERQYLRGRLTLDELAVRVELALRARDRRELSAALRGLPPVWRDREELRRITRTLRRSVVRALLLAAWVAFSFLLLGALVLGALLQGLTSGVVLVFAGIWLAMTIVAVRAGRRA